MAYLCFQGEARKSCYAAAVYQEWRSVTNGYLGALELGTEDPLARFWYGELVEGVVFRTSHCFPATLSCFVGYHSTRRWKVFVTQFPYRSSYGADTVSNSSQSSTGSIWMESSKWRHGECLLRPDHCDYRAFKLEVRRSCSGTYCRFQLFHVTASIRSWPYGWVSVLRRSFSFMTMDETFDLSLLEDEPIKVLDWILPITTLRSS